MIVGAAEAAGHIPLLHAVVLGAVQGLSEFLPISSSGHLILVPWLFGWKELIGPANAELNRTFDVALHMGTFVAAVAYFRADLARLAAAGWNSLRRRSVEGTDERLAWLLAIATLPGVLVGALLEAAAGDTLDHIPLVAVLLIVFGGILLAADRMPSRRGADAFGLRDAVVMGVAQAAALVPGVSRSGVTISASRALGFHREDAARLSFLMSIPIIGGAGVFQGAKVLASGGLPSGTGGAFLAGMVTSAVTGTLAVWVVLRVVQSRSFLPFVLYRVAAGTAVLALVAAGFR